MAEIYKSSRNKGISTQFASGSNSEEQNFIHSQSHNHNGEFISPPSNDFDNKHIIRDVGAIVLGPAVFICLTGIWYFTYCCKACKDQKAAEEAAARRASWA
ncbi:uncharacterized protein MELLADRAFT_109308 [Melampsora larici-populina 98AG31]|uniref:Uncharacterized protein n=1 Tax=Melampsora larici-populina (strain 98AG31 / pathotype 3-4-7) TaxID=747676 RepID=F4RW20_MELLP|nr:uncharacterized protein MELLADRAFT_109308 [Melampsora larici-populina 98AG31]EGG03487.1 hypothetical protein MELLADRAFT_109308 [Melampsora larici-populina 98AG31]